MWFYDDLTEAKDTLVGISGATDFLTSSSGRFLVGIDCIKAPDNYLVTEGAYDEGYFALGPPRTLGWHHVAFKYTTGGVGCFLDNVLLHATLFQWDWNTILLMEGSSCADGKAWFDEVDVFWVVADPVENASWGAIKAAY